MRLLVAALLLIPILSGCGGKDSFRLQTLAKTEIDMVADLHLQTAEAIMKELTAKLYARNPRELGKASQHTVDDRIYMLHGLNRYFQRFDELGEKRSIDAIQLALDESYQGDRVFALMGGLATMIRTSYDNKEEFFITDRLDEQKLYNSARNIEIMLWQLQQRKLSSGESLLLTNGTGSEINLSFERLFGKLIATQDMMAELMAQRNQRTIRQAVHAVGSVVFIPI